jgi:adenosine deaminase
MQDKLIEFVAKIPKSDLHVHLDGSIRVETLIDLSKKHNLPLPSYTVEGLNQLVYKDHYASLVEYLVCFDYVIPVMQTPEDIERISYEFAMDNIMEGVRYVEVKLTPQSHINENQDIEQVLLSVNNGLNRAKTEYNQNEEVKKGNLPPFNYGIVACVRRFFTRDYSKYYNTFIDVHKYSNPNLIFSMASLELVKACVAIRDKHNIPIVAIDLVGPEAGNPPIHHKDAYHFAHQNLMHLTAHAGEASGPESIFQAVTELYARRIGHGFFLFSKDHLLDTSVKDKGLYIKRLVQYLAESSITIEVCLTSNLQTIPGLNSINDHPFAQMLDNHLSTTICTDNRTIGRTTVSNELLLALQNFSFDEDKLQSVVLNGFTKGFYASSPSERAQFLAQVTTQYKRLVEEYRGVLEKTVFNSNKI